MKKTFKMVDLECANCAAKMEAAIKKLEPRQQYLIEQVYFAGRKKTDIAREEGVSHVAIVTAVQRAVKKLKKILA